ncbi:GNAT family N-acetyltransferase [Actinoplanes solisilvae]|uniref:GNAT family N-acetyltransferase n=1 Tax=Actinoplanes solisilvae TaxID=2486853 RepID=UPI0032C4B028
MRHPDAPSAALECLVAAHRRIAAVIRGGHQRHRDSGIYEAVLGAPIPDLNVLYCINSNAGRDELSAAAARMDGYGLPWSLQAPVSVAAGAAEVAASYGLTVGSTAPVMAKRLVRADAVPVPGTRRARGNDSSTYLHTLAEGFECLPQLFGGLCEGQVLDQPTIRAFLAEKDGVPSATALGVQVRELTGVFNVTVRPRFRGGGHGGAAAAAVLADAYRSGARTALLTARPRGYDLFRRMGFVQIDTWVVFERHRAGAGPAGR